MFVSPFTVSLSCDVAIVVIYLQRPGEFGGSPWFAITDGHVFTTEIVDAVWLAIVRIAFMLPHVLEFLKRRRLSCPGFHHTFVVANFFFVVAKAAAILIDTSPSPSMAFLWWLLLILSAVSIVAQRWCLHHLRSSMPTPRYKTIFLGSRLDSRLLDEQYGDCASGSDEDYDDSDYSSTEEFGRGADDSSRLETGELAGGGGAEETKASLGRSVGASRRWAKGSKPRRQRSGSRGTSYSTAGPRRRGRQRRLRSRSSRQESTRELVDYFAERMQEARDAWSARVSALQKRWQASFMRGDGWGMRGGGNPAADRDAALRLTFGLIVRMYAYKDALQDLAEQDPACLEAFAPQFASFLVWNSYYMSGQMEAWLLARCSENVYFAHALEFQLRASCLPSASAAGAGASLGAAPAALGEDRAGSGATSESSSRAFSAAGRQASMRRRSSGRDMMMAEAEAEAREREREEGEGGGGGGGGGTGGAAIDRFGRRAVELLLRDIAEKGELAARGLVDADGADSGGTAAVGGGGVGGGGGDDESWSLVRAPMGAATAMVAGDERVDLKEERAQGEGGGGGGGGDVGGDEIEKQVPLLYRQTPDFLARLADIASFLTPLSKAERTPALKEKLEEVAKEFLGAGTTTTTATAAGNGGGGGGGGGNSSKRLVYVPVGGRGRHHRIVAVHPSESFAFSTRERAPCFVCLEVVGAEEEAAVRPRQRGGPSEAGFDFYEGEGEEEWGGGIGGGGGGGDGGSGNVLLRRIRSLRRWLPSGVSLQERLRFPGSKGGGKGWTLSLASEEGDDDDANESGRSAVRREGQGTKEEAENSSGANASASGTLQDLERGKSTGSIATNRRSGTDKGDTGIGRGRGGRGERGNNPDAGGDNHYRLLMEEGAEASSGSAGGGTLSMQSICDAREWWVPSNSGTVEPWGGDDDVGDDALADVPERHLLQRAMSAPASRRVGRSGSNNTEAAAGEAVEVAGGSERHGTGEDGVGDDKGRGEAGGGAVPQPQVLFNELWHDKSNRIRRVSPWAEEPGWRLLPVIVKSNDDLRQEQLASQLLFAMQRILRAEGVGAWLRPYDIVALSADTGIVEAVPDTISLDALRRYRKRGGGDGMSGSGEGGDSSVAASRFSLTGFFEARFGAKGSEGFRRAQRRFIESLAAYSIACYLLQIKDRHNGNILLDTQGRIIHVDFGFMLANSPGGNLGFESAPFKLTQGFLNLMGGTRSRCFREFKGLCVDTFLALRRNSQEIVLLVEMMASGNETLPCFQGPGGGAAAAADLAARFQPDLNDPACQDFVHKLCAQAAGSWTTAWYDKYQRFWSGIY
ncbi:unnamed protein product [Pylaiella littoralis]